MMMKQQQQPRERGTARDSSFKTVTAVRERLGYGEHDMPCMYVLGYAVRSMLAGHHCLPAQLSSRSIQTMSTTWMDGCDVPLTSVQLSKDHALANSHPFIHQAHITLPRVASHHLYTALRCNKHTRHGLIWPRLRFRSRYSLQPRHGYCVRPSILWSRRGRGGALDQNQVREPSHQRRAEQ